MSDTIYALASAAGRAGVAVIRVSGPDALGGLRLLTGGKEVAPRVATLCRLQSEEEGGLIDRALVLYFPAPASYTGEDVAEYHIHGGPAVIEGLLGSLGGIQGYRLAAPGEFTRRAFENGKMDLTAAEAVADLIDAETEAQKIQALDQMGGALAVLYEGWAEKLARILAYCEAEIDFPDEDLPEDLGARVTPQIAPLRQEIDDHLQDGRRGERLREGVKVAVIGAPNAGKSSLVNVLARRDVAIVSAQPGTTRDIIEVHLDLGGYPVIIADTAGLRPDQIGQEGHDAIEQEGIKRALRVAGEADIRLLLFDASMPAPDPHTSALRNEDALVVWNKADLTGREERQEGIYISTKTGAGLGELIKALEDRVAAKLLRRDTPSLTRQRHRQALEQTRESLDRALEAQEGELLAEDLRLAIRALGRITGRVDVEDLLDVIFRDFCIGK